MFQKEKAMNFKTNKEKGISGLGMARKTFFVNFLWTKNAVNIKNNITFFSKKYYKILKFYWHFL